ncbi:hypothetical protein [Sporomusa aerivorans]
MAKKRGHGEGSVFEGKDRPGTWRASFALCNLDAGEYDLPFIRFFDMP